MTDNSLLHGDERVEGERCIAFAAGDGPDGQPIVTEMVTLEGFVLIRDYQLTGPDAGQRHVLHCSTYPELCQASYFRYAGIIVPMHEIVAGVSS